VDRAGKTLFEVDCDGETFDADGGRLVCGFEGVEGDIMTQDSSSLDNTLRDKTHLVFD
jgi:hypothetical protein